MEKPYDLKPQEIQTITMMEQDHLRIRARYGDLRREQDGSAPDDGSGALLQVAGDVNINDPGGAALYGRDRRNRAVVLGSRLMTNPPSEGAGSQGESWRK